MRAMFGYEIAPQVVQKRKSTKVTDSDVLRRAGDRLGVFARKILPGEKEKLKRATSSDREFVDIRNEMPTSWLLLFVVYCMDYTE